MRSGLIDLNVSIMNHLKHICKGKGIKNSFNIMIAILSFANNIQAKIDLAIWKTDQRWEFADMRWIK